MKHFTKMRKESKLKSFKRITSLSLISTFLILLLPSKTYALDYKDISKNPKPFQDTVLKNPENKKEILTENNKPKGEENNLLKESIKKSDKKYSFEELNKLNYTDLISLIKTITYENVPDLFNFTNGSLEFFGDKNRVEAIINALLESGKTYTKDDSKGIQTLVEFLRAAYYLGYYNDKLSYLNTEEYKSKCIPAINAIEDNKNFYLGTKVQNEVIDATGRLIGNSSCNVETINKTINVLKDFRENIKSYGSDFYKSNAVYNILKGIDYYTNSTIYKAPNYNPKETIFYKNIEPFIKEVDNLSLLGDQMNKDNAWLLNNSLYFTGRFSKFREDSSKSQKVLEKAMKIYPYLSYQYIEALNDLNKNFNGKFSNGSDIDFNKVKEAAKKKYTPKTYTFDDGKFIVKAGDKVSEDKIKRLYWASKEVKAQFIRLVQNDKPLESGNKDDILTVVIYNSPEEYKLNRIIYGFDTNNGGIYIEPLGTFFTYERTKEESIYTLEELFRHEFTHYLQGRYVVPGMFGNGDFYKNGDLTWYEEGTAEFFAGSTRTDGIKPRKSVAQGISPERDNRMSLNSILHAKYGSFEFYNYGFALSNYMYSSNLDLFKKMTEYIKDNNFNSYKDFIESMASDSNLNESYQKYMDNLLKNVDDLTVPLVSDEYVNGHNKKDITEITNDIKDVSKIKELKTKIEKSDYFTTFDITGTFALSKSKGENNDFKDMDTKLNNILKELSKKDWNGYKTVTAYFVNHRVNKDGNYEYDVTFHGINEDSNTEVYVNKKPAPIISAKSKVEALETVKFDASKSFDEDGKIEKYEWDFGDSNKSKEKVINHTYKSEGKYTVTLTVTDDKGEKNKTTFDINVTKAKPLESMTEKEPNNRYENANEISKTNLLINGSLSEKDNVDRYSFTLSKRGEVSILVNNLNSIGMTWTLQKDGDFNNFVLYGSEKDSLISGSKTLDEGKYYLTIYNFDGNSGDYKAKIKGSTILENDTSPKVIKETEFNGDFKNANKVQLNSIIKGSLSEKDTTDMFEIDVDKTTDLNILVKNLDNIKMNWLLYSSKDLNNYMGYAKIDKDTLKNSYNLSPGKYYLCIYDFDKIASGKYEINLNNN